MSEKGACTIKCGQYTSSVGKLVVSKSGDNTHIHIDMPGPSPSWTFGPDGVFRGFGISSKPESKPEIRSNSNSILVCKHVDPEYEGTIYRQSGLGGAMVVCVCPSCIVLSGEIRKGVSIAGMDKELWQSMVESGAVNITDMEI